MCLNESNLYFLYWRPVFGLCGSSVYLNCSTSSSVFLFIHMLESGLRFMLLTRIFLVAADFHAVASSCFLPSFSELLEFFFSWPPSRSMSSPNRKLQSGHPLWTLTTVGRQFLLHHLKSSLSMMDAEVSKLSALSFP